MAEDLISHFWNNEAGEVTDIILRINELWLSDEIRVKIIQILDDLLYIKNKEKMVLKDELEIVGHLPNYSHAFIISERNWEVNIVWKSSHLEDVNENFIKYKLENINICKYIDDARKSDWENVNLNTTFILNEKKYYISMAYNGINWYFSIYLTPAILFKENIVDSLQSMLEAAELRDPETKEHLDRISIFSKLLSEKLREKWFFTEFITDEFIEDISLSSPLHDLWKVWIPDHILLKPWKLTDDEFLIMKEHTEKWWRLIKWLINKFWEIPILKMASNITTFHHEKYNGCWYPYWLVSTEIPLEARIVSIVDVFDALKSIRPYKKPFTDEDTRKLLEEWSWQHFDPNILNVFLEHFDEFLKVRESIMW